MGIARQYGGGVCAIGVLLFLFSGLYKVYMPSPVDLSVVAAALTSLGIVLCFDRVQTAALRQPVILLWVALTAWVALRAFPYPSAWGLRKLAEAVLFGGVAVGAGFIIAARAKVQEIFLKVTAWGTLPVTIYFLVTIDPDAWFQYLGTSYQMTGYLFGFIAVAAAVLRLSPITAVALLASTATGNISGVAFGITGVVAVMIAAPNWRNTWTTVVFFLIVLAVFVGFKALPDSLDRLAPKVAQTISTVAPEIVAPAEPIFNTRTGEIEQPAEYDRLNLFRAGVEEFLGAPFAGHGFGKADYQWDAYPHNLIIELAAETGIVGLALGLALMGACVYSAWIGRATPLALGMIVMFGLISMVSGYWAGRLILFAVGLCAGAYFAYSRNIASYAAAPNHGIPAK